MNQFKLALVDFGQASSSVASRLGSGTSPGDIISRIVTLFFPIAGFALLAMLIMSGYKYMVSSGDPKALASAQSGITYAIIGFLVIFSAYFIVNFFGVALDIKQIQDMF